MILQRRLQHHFNQEWEYSGSYFAAQGGIVISIGVIGIATWAGAAGGWRKAAGALTIVVALCIAYFCMYFYPRKTVHN